jgi:methyl-accepting chemotaxis protein
MTFLIMTVVISISILTIDREQRSFRKELQQQAELLLVTLRVAISDSLYQFDTDALSDMMEALGQDREILAFGRIYDTESQIIADAYDEDLVYLAEFDPLGQKFLESSELVFEWQADQLLAGQAVVIGNQPLGAICIGLSTSPLKAKITAVRNQGIGIALVAGLIGILLALQTARSVTKPLQPLVKTIDQIAKGDLTGTSSPRECSS